MRHLLVLSLVLLMMSLFAVVALAQPLGAARVYSCAELKQAPIPNTTITLAQAQPASTNPPAPAHCEIVGKINERVGQDGKPHQVAFIVGGMFIHRMEIQDKCDMIGAPRCG